MLEVISVGVRMTTIDTVGNIPTIQNGNAVNNQPKVSFRASIPTDNEVDTFISEQEKAKKKAKNQQRLNTGIQIGVLAALLGSVGLTAWMMLGKGPAKTNFAKISEKMPSLSDDCVNPKVKNFINKTIKILSAPSDYLKYTGANAPRMVLFHGPTGTGKTFSAKLMAKEMNAEYAEIQFSDLSSEYVGKTAVNISKKFKEIAKIAKKNPDKQYVVAFNEIDSLINNVNKLGSNNMHLGQNRTSFLNGLDSVKDIHNLTIVGTTNINPKTANLDAATLSRLGNIFEIEKPIQKEIKSALKFHLNKSEAAKDLIKNDTELDRIADMIFAKNGAQRDVDTIVNNALSDFTVTNLEKADNKTIKFTADYLENAIKNKETWAAGINETTTNAQINNDAQNKLMDAFWRFIAKNAS